MPLSPIERTKERKSMREERDNESSRDAAARTARKGFFRTVPGKATAAVLVIAAAGGEVHGAAGLKRRAPRRSRRGARFKARGERGPLHAGLPQQPPQAAARGQALSCPQEGDGDFTATENPWNTRSSSLAPQPGQTTLPLSFSATEQRTSNCLPQELQTKV